MEWACGYTCADVWKHGSGHVCTHVQAWEWVCVHTCADVLTHVGTCESKSCYVVSSIHCFSIFFIFFSEIMSLTRPGPRTQDPAAFAPSAHYTKLSFSCVGATDLRLGPRACAVSTLAPPAPGFHSHCIVSFPPVMFAEPEPSPAPIIYSTRSNLSPTVWYLPTIQSDIWKFTISISHLQSWICIWIVIGKIADIIFMREVHSECNCIVRLSLLSTCSNWTSWEVISAIKKHKA